MRDRTANQIKEGIQKEKLPKEIKLTLIRHGETKGNTEHRYLGITDEPLTGQGRQKLQAKKDEGYYPSAAGTVFVSPMLRCRETAALLFPECEPVCFSEWTEMKFGIYEGKNYEELNGQQEYQAWIDSGGTLPFPGGESREEFKERVMRGFEKMLDFLEKSRRDVTRAQITAVVHGGTIMALCSSLLGGEYFDYQLKCGEKYECYITIR